MFARIVRNQYIGKSKVDFTFYGGPVSGTTLIGDISLPFMDKEGNPFTTYDPHLPDVIIPGTVTDISTMEIACDPNLSLDKVSIMYITGIPKNARSLDDYRLNNVIWQSYYEDSYRGYLFQILKASEPVSLKENNEGTLSIQFKYGTPRIYQAI